ncbi:unnamed protein product [Cuscuta epithymum]|uniref:UBC core domain-containing protein n=1 Tax=Cuscuta epithymum TaxID=186058 RepID=A0AAV0FI54_9ASTE|nr:unnamed protein product [Cuscuta epithymum]
MCLLRSYGEPQQKGLLNFEILLLLPIPLPENPTAQPWCSHNQLLPDGPRRRSLLTSLTDIPHRRPSLMQLQSTVASASASQPCCKAPLCLRLGYYFSSLSRWVIEVTGAPGTLYANETYELQVEFP